MYQPRAIKKSVKQWVDVFSITEQQDDNFLLTTIAVVLCIRDTLH
jgi:hypothetical protein